MRWEIIIAAFPEVIRPELSPTIWKIHVFSLPKGSRTEKGAVAQQLSQVVGCSSVDITTLTEAQIQNDLCQHRDRAKN